MNNYQANHQDINYHDTSQSFIGYEYKNVVAPKDMAPIYMDGYQNFGWQPDNTGGISSGLSASVLKLKRDRKILNKTELTRLQRQFESCLNEITSLQNSVSTMASIIAFTIGLIGCAFMAGSVFAIAFNPINIILCIILAIPGFICWGLSYVGYKTIRRKRQMKVETLVDEKYDEVYEVCEKGSALLH